jgi:outer membrane protein OmpA-like peptidoglycan-associated protein
VPHEEVSFPTGSSAIPPAEEPKLDKSLAAVVQAIHRSGQFADLHLYVVGHTDTVGNDETNQKLSEARARSIANFFRTHGVHIPIYYDGLGAHALAVPTADQVDEPKNRRAEYIIAITDPAIAHATGPCRWKKL